MEAHRKDYEAKVKAIRAWLEQRQADGLLLTSVTNFGWLTHGRSFVSLASERSVAQVLITLDRVVLFTTTNEAPRLELEEVAGWGLEIVAWPWYERFEDHWPRLGFTHATILSDREVESELSLLRQRLSLHEQNLLQQLGQDSAALLERFCLQVQPGSSGYELAGELSRLAWSAGMEPLVLNMATDERALQFRHAIPAAPGLKRYGVFSVCFRRHGLHVTLTRSVHFGPVSPELQKRHQVAVALEVAAQTASVVGARVGSLVEGMLSEYRRLGWPDEWKQHPLGGCLGFQPREYDVVPDSAAVLSAGQGFCWNPTVQGAKSEQTFFVTEAGPVGVTQGSLFPTLKVTLCGIEHTRPAILQR